MPSASKLKVSEEKDKKREQRAEAETTFPLHKNRREQKHSGGYREGERAKYWKIEKL